MPAKRSPGKRKFEDQLAALDALRAGDGAAAAGPLRKALTHSNNFVVAKAADLVRDFALADLIPELLAAFDRFFDDPVKSDPQCWAKNAISRTLAHFEHQDADVFLRGMKHIQNEPVWGGQSDTAGTLRSTCALALVQCRSLTETQLLNHLLELFSDKDKSVRVEAARAVEHTGSPACALLLRLRAILGSDEPEVLGACYSGVLHIEGKSALPWVSRFLEGGDDAAAEAALAIAAVRSPEAFHALKKCFEQEGEFGFRPHSRMDPWFRSVLLSAMALTRQEEAIDFLITLVRTESLDAESGIEAILRSGASPETVEKLEEAVAGNPRLLGIVAANRK
jgi:hypothetical protein